MSRRWVGRTALALAAVVLVGLGVPLWHYFPGHNLRTVEAGAFYGSRQMSGPALERYIDKLGIKTVLNLRGDNTGSDWFDAEAAVCAERGIPMYNFRWSRNSIPDPESLLRFLDILDQAEPPFLAHCQGGTHRTGLAAAVYELQHGKTVAEAREQFGIGFGDAPIGQVLALYEGSPLPFRQWVEEQYPAAYAAWNAAREAAKAVPAPIAE